MIASRAKTIGGQIGLIVVLTGVVALLTILFNLGGALSIAVITGMMTSVSRKFKWQHLIVSLVSPFVVLLLGAVAKVELEERQRLLLAAVCFGAFWGTYLVTFLLMAAERRNESAPAGPAASRATSGACETSPMPAGAGSSSDLPFHAKSESSETQPAFSLDQLQGRWLCAVEAPDRPGHQKVLAITQSRFSLRIGTDSGQNRLVAEGDVVVQARACARSVTLSESSPGELPS